MFILPGDTVTATGPNSFSPSSNFSLSAGSTLNLNNYNQSIDGVQGGSPSQVLLGSAFLTTTGTTGYGGVISGTGGIIVSGGTAGLGGTNTYSGGTTVNSGTLSILADSNLGAPGSSVIVNSGGTLILRNAAINRQLTLGGVLEFVPVTFGGLAGSFDGMITLVGQHASIDVGFSVAAPQPLSAQITGVGTLNKINYGALILTGNNSYTGGTVITNGRLIVGSDNALGASSGRVTVSCVDANTCGGLKFTGSFTSSRSVTVVGYGIIGVDPGKTVALTGIIDGSGGLSAGGAGTLVLSGNNSYAGGTFIGSGTLAISSDANLGTANTNVTFANGFDSTLKFLNGFSSARQFWVAYNAEAVFDTNGHNVNLTTPIASQQGFLSKVGSGTLAIAGTENIVSTEVKAGTLALGTPGQAAQMLGAVEVHPGASFAANGALDIGYFEAGGTFYPHSRIRNEGIVSTLSPTSKLQIAGEYYQEVSGTLVVPVAPASGGLIAAGAASLAGTLNVVPAAGVYGAGASYQILVANGGITGSFANPTATVPGFDFVVVQSSTDIKASLIHNVIVGDLTLTSDYTGNTTITGGTVQIGNGGTTGSIVGDVTNYSTLAFNRSDTIAFPGSISGTGGVGQVGSGVTILGAINTYTGATRVSGGTLDVSGSIASSSISVMSGGTLTGTGKTGPVAVASGGTLSPGTNLGTGALTVLGNLNLASDSTTRVYITPTTSSTTNATGTASINGMLVASAAPGTYSVGQSYSLISAGGVSGTYASLATPGLPFYLKGGLSYGSNNVYLTLGPNTLAPALASITTNQQSVVGAIDAAVATVVVGNNTPPTGFAALYGLSGPALSSALDQISGQAAPNTINAVGQASLSFLTMTAQGGSNGGSFAPGSAYGAADAPHRAQLGAGETRVWGAAYGGHVSLSADAASGAASLSASNAGLIGGADMAWDDGWLAGVTVGLGRQHFSSGNGTGESDDIMIGIYARKDAGPLYVTAAFGYGSHHIETLRVITVSGTDVLQGKQRADDYGGRVEAGWRMALDDQYTLSPYFAVAAESFETPAYAETVLSGASIFALSFAAHSSTLGRTEMGTGLSRDYETENGTVTADLRAAWAHQLDDLPFTQASFQTLPGASFLVTGVRPASDTALLGASVQVQNRSGLFFGLKGETQLGVGTTILEGMGNLGWRW